MYNSPMPVSFGWGGSEAQSALFVSIPEKECFVITFGGSVISGLTLPSSAEVSWDHLDNLSRWHSVCFWRALTCLLQETRAGILFLGGIISSLLCLAPDLLGSGHAPGRKTAQISFQWLVYTSGLSVIAVINNFKYTGLKQHPASISQFPGVRVHKEKVA